MSGPGAPVSPTPGGGGPAGGLTGRVVNGAVMLVGGNLGVRLLGILGVAVLARLLSPDDYGVMALALVAVGLVNTASELRVADALVRAPAITPAHLGSAFALTLLRGVAMAALLFIVAEPVAAAVETPALGPALKALAVTPLIDGLVSPRLGVFLKALDFRRDVVITVGAKIAMLSVSIGAAWVQPSHWALVYGVIAGSCARTALSYAVAPWRPVWDVSRLRELLSFGVWLSASGLINFMNYKSDTVLIGVAYDAQTLGQYSIGDQISTVATHQIAGPITRSIYSGLAATAADLPRLRAAYKKAQAAVLALMLPLGVGVALVASDLVRVVAGSQWSGAVIVVQIVSPAIALGLLNAGAQSLLMARGQTKRIFERNALNFIARLPLILIGAALAGVVGVLIGRALSTLFLVWNTARIVAAEIDDVIWAPIVAAWRSFASVAIMTAAVLALSVALPAPAPFETRSVEEAALRLAFMAALGAGVYGAAHVALWLVAGRPDGVEITASRTLARLLAALRRRIGAGPRGEPPAAS